MIFLPEGHLLNTKENTFLTANMQGLKRAFSENTTIEAIATVCDMHHNLIIDFNGTKGIIPREECAIGIAEGFVRDIAIISKVNKPVSFKVTGFSTDNAGSTIVMLSRVKAQVECTENYVSKLEIGTIIPAKITYLDTFGAFVDIGCGVVSLVPIDLISISRISHPKDRFTVGQDIFCVVKSFSDNNKICLSHKELLGSWEDNAKLFNIGETVKGVVRSVEEYGIFIELSPNLAGLAEFVEGVKVGQCATVYIKNIIPEKMKVKLVIIDTFDDVYKAPLSYYLTPENKSISEWIYSPETSFKSIVSYFPEH